MNAAERDQAALRHLNIVDAARMFAAVDMTMCDALITTWQAKLGYGFWRPITAIQLADTDGNPATLPDPTWTPLLATPNYPDYTSGYNAEIASSSRALEELFGPGHLHLTLISTAVPGATRRYDDGAALRADVVNARVWLGIHFRFADIGARTLGTALAGWTLRHYFQPTATPSPAQGRTHTPVFEHSVSSRAPGRRGHARASGARTARTVPSRPSR
jgi:hypothetical protein